MADDAMNDAELNRRIGELVSEEHELRGGHAGLDDGGRARLASLETQLDQAWDLLRQRRARREYGENPDDARQRPADEVESYRQ